MIRLHTFGTLDLRDAEGSVLQTVLVQPRRLALLAYLSVASPPGFHRRDSILPLFWPERDTGSARAALNRSLHFLRHHLGEAVIVSRGDEEVGLDSARIWCDAAVFNVAIALGQFRRAADLYRGELLPGFFVSEAPGFEAWLESRRENLRQTAAHVAGLLADEEERGGDLGSATRWARRAAELVPLEEEPIRRLLRLLDRAGDRAAALHAYSRFAQNLARELEVPPSPETQRLIEVIRDRAPAKARVASSPDLFIPTPAPGASLPASPDRRRSGWLLTVVVVALAAVGTSLLPVGVPPTDPLSVDVAPPRNRTGEASQDRAARLAAERMILSIQQTGLADQVRLLDGAESSRRAGTLVTGAIERDSGNIRLRVWVTDVKRGRPPWAVPPVDAPATSVVQAVEWVRPRVAGAVAVLLSETHATLLPVAGPPPTFEAFQEFMEGMQLESRGLLAKALERYRWAAAVDSTFTWPLVHGSLATMGASGEDLIHQRDSLLLMLTSPSRRLPPLQAELIKHVLAVRAENWEGSYRALRAAAQLAPEHFGYMFTIKALQLNRLREVVEVLARPQVESTYVDRIQSYWNVLTFSLHYLGEHRTELNTARRARRGHPHSASALSQEIRALTALGRLPAVRLLLDTVSLLPREGWLTTGSALGVAAAELRAHGHGAASAEALQQGIAWYRSRPAEERAAQESRELLGELLYQAGGWDEADAMFRVLAREFPASHGYPDNAYYLGRLGTIAARLGHRAIAREMAERLKAMDRPQPLPGQESIVYRAAIAALLGDRESAMRLLIDAFGAPGTTSLHVDIDFEGMQSYPPFQEFTRPKG